jgi:valyl-tRNA synthetase
MEIPKKYDPKVTEPKLQKFWEDKAIYKFNKKSKKPFFTIDMPPPTVSGKMHVGHAFSYAQEDFFARYKRMRGFEVFLPFGTDDNGLATEKLIAKIKKVRAKDMSRKEYFKLCLDTIAEIRPDFVSDWKRLGFSSDYTLAYSTINEHCQRTSQKAFLELIEKGEAYRKESPVIWDTKFQTALAQAELESKDVASTFNDIVFKDEKGKEVIIATTRPELLCACVAVFVHPDDKKHNKLVGKELTVPVYHHKVKVLTDKRVDPEKGTGIVMCCTFGDQTDIEWYKAYNLPLRVAIAKYGKMTELAGKYEGMKVKDARKAILEDMKVSSELVSQKEIMHAVSVGERSGVEIEIIESPQWFIKVLDKREVLEKAAEKLNWTPQFMKHRYDNWLKGLQWDWCVSRQRSFGIPLPVWYSKKTGEVILPSVDQLPVDPLVDVPSKLPKGHTKKDIVGDSDVLDTWATSSLTPQIAAGLVPEMYDKLYPMDLRQNSHDIITFWLFNAVVRSQLSIKKNPWKDVLVTGWVLDPKGKKMSKSKGNVVDPREVWDKYSVDAQRFTAAGIKLGSDYPYQEKDVITGQKTVTKLWNASKFSFMHLEDYNGKEPKLEAFDSWLLLKLNKLIKQSTQSMEEYAYSKCKSAVESFFWNDLCDFYLEIVKDRLYNPDQRGKGPRESGQYVLYRTLLDTLKLFAPFMPYITEEVYQLFYKKSEKQESIHLTSWPSATEKYQNKEIEEVGDRLIEVISLVRKVKSENSVSLKEPVKEIVLDLPENKVVSFLADLKAVTKAEKISYGKKLEVKL